MSRSNSSDTDRRHWRDAAVRAAHRAAAFIAERGETRAELVWEEKAATDFVSLVDIGAEERIREMLSSEIPELRFVGEELGPADAAGGGLVAVVDPLDGTTNFLHGYPNYCVSIAIVLDGVPQAAVVHDVARGGVSSGVHTATAGGGAFVDGVPLAVSRTDRPARALVGTGFPFKSEDGMERYLEQMRALIPHVSGLRRAGAAALDLCDLARGRFDMFWELELAPWDIAAGLLLVREAGGRVTDFDGQDAPVALGPIVASNGIMHDWFLERLRV